MQPRQVEPPTARWRVIAELERGRLSEKELEETLLQLSYRASWGVVGQHDTTLEFYLQAASSALAMATVGDSIRAALRTSNAGIYEMSATRDD